MLLQQYFYDTRVMKSGILKNPTCLFFILVVQLKPAFFRQAAMLPKH
jgi:hypothetical protein